jgi:hypothetical protein
MIGRYVTLEEADIDGYLANLTAGISYHGANGISDMLNGVGDAIGSSIDSLGTKEFYCCIFYELLRSSKIEGVADNIKIYRVDEAGNIILRNRYNSDSEYQEAYNNGTPISLDDILENPNLSIQHIEMFLQEQRVWLRQLHAILNSMLPLLSGNSLSLNWNAGCFNVVAIMHTSITIMLTTMLNTIQEHLYEQAVQWGKERIEASKNPTTVNRCLPWEQLFMGMITALFGPDGWAKQVRELISRMQEYTINKSKEIAMEGADSNSTIDSHPWLPKLNASIDIIEWLIDLNAQAFMVCATHRPDRFEDDRGGASSSEILNETTDGSSDTSTLGKRYTTGATRGSGRSQSTGVPYGGSVGSKEGSTYSPLSEISRQVDITGEKIDPISLLIGHKDDDVAKFFTQYMGLTKQEANEALSKAKRGECLKALGVDEVQDLKNALNNVGLEI